MLLICKSTISTGPFSMSQTVDQRVYSHPQQLLGIYIYICLPFSWTKLFLKLAELFVGCDEDQVNIQIYDEHIHRKFMSLRDEHCRHDVVLRERFSKLRSMVIRRGCLLFSTCCPTIQAKDFLRKFMEILEEAMVL